jgi:hypothetical protein
LQKTGGFARNWPLAHATGGQSLINCNRLAASRMQIAPAWPPVACKIKKIDGNLPATGGHICTICMRLGTIYKRLAASRMQVLYATGGHPDTICLELAARRTLFLYHVTASRMQIVSEWPPVAKKFKKICFFHDIFTFVTFPGFLSCFLYSALHSFSVYCMPDF